MSSARVPQDRTQDRTDKIRRTSVDGAISFNDVLQLGLDKGDTKPFWRYVRAQRQDNAGTQLNSTQLTTPKEKSGLQEERSYKSLYKSPILQ